ncbi:N-acetylmuramoyl-L-alanine amidase [Streptomyces xanthochromogenes]|uniref:N-acetylmuramoyl-L-alanine amidase n=1 Tax=Streptomyces xanthochromogenes TaxID=67384 RepID=UPI00381BCA87
MNSGDGHDPWPEAQVDEAARWSAALCRAHGWSQRSVIGHMEWQPGKPDPSLSMDDFRARVGVTCRAGHSGGKQTPRRPRVPRHFGVRERQGQRLDPPSRPTARE